MTQKLTKAIREKRKVTDTKGKKPLKITEIMESYIQTIGDYYFLTAKQITKVLGYKPSMYSNVQPRLGDLVDASYLQTIHLPTIEGKSPYIYTLAHKGVKYLREQGRDIEVVYKPSEIAELNHSWLKHLLELNDVLICAKHVEKGTSGFALHKMWHDLELKRKPLQAPVSLMALTEQEKKSTRLRPVVPDGVLVFHKAEEGKKTKQFAMWLEHDRGTEGKETIQRKVRSIVAVVLSGAVKEYFDVKRLGNVCFITSAGSDRAETLRKWTMEALASLHVKADIRDLFLFSYFPYHMDEKIRKIVLEELDHAVLFCTPVWQLCLKEEKPIALLEV